MRLGIRARALGWLGFLGFAMVALLYPVSIRWLDQALREFEQYQITRESDRVHMAIAADAERLRVSAEDYGHWDESMAFMVGKEPNYIEDNYYPEVLTNLGVQFVLIIAPDREVLWAGELELGAEPKVVPLESAALMPLLPEAALERARMQLKAVSEFAWIDDHGALLGISAISDNRAGQFGGWLVFGAHLNASYCQALSVKTGVSFGLERWVPKATTKGDAADIDILISTDGFTARQPIFSAGAEPMLDIVSGGPRPLQAQQEKAQQLLLAAVMFTVLGGLVLTYFVLHLLVIRRVRALGAWARGLQFEARDGPADADRRADKVGDEIDHLREDFAALTRELQRVTERWRLQAWQDWLTKAGNRARLIHDLNGAALAPRQDSEAVHDNALFLIDLDNFKAVNDLLGHLSGDELLRAVAERIAAVAPAQASTYRMGGDEFALLWRGCDGRDGVDALAMRLLDALRLVHKTVHVSASIGIFVGDFRQTPIHDVLMRADIALFSAKRNGRDLYRYFDPQDHERFRERFDLEALLKEAIKADQLSLCFQPIIDAESGTVVALEALARWQHPERGSIPPSRFVAVAERSTLIIELDLMVLRHSCVALKHLHQRFPALLMNINVSPLSLQSSGFIERVDSVLSASGIDPAALRLELTESGLGLGSHALDEAVAALRVRGIAMVIDDFGAGASSLSRLSCLQPAGLKLDGSFSRDWSGAGGRICRAIMELARELDMKVTAEFVESAAQREFFVGIGCNYLQGHHFSEALRVDAIEAWLEARTTGNQQQPVLV